MRISELLTTSFDIIIEGTPYHFHAGQKNLQVTLALLPLWLALAVFLN